MLCLREAPRGEAQTELTKSTPSLYLSLVSQTSLVQPEQTSSYGDRFIEYQQLLPNYLYKYRPNRASLSGIQ